MKQNRGGSRPAGPDRSLLSATKKDTTPDTGAPVPEEIIRITNAVVDGLGTADMESCLTVLCNILGQVVAELSEGKPSKVQAHGNSVAEAVKKAAILKLMHVDDKRRATEH